MIDNPYTSAELAQFKEKIEAKIEEEEKILADWNKQRLNHSDKNSAYGDGGKSDQILMRLGGLIEKKQHYLQRLKSSLLRIENNTYGIDLKTGEKIDKLRLEAELTATENI